ncbi:MAG: cell division protein FtsZ [Alphaproteobacteria bacterium]|nr:cell division protein FtsZ [Alphaproteobacteria bacterium]MDE1968073.1 cell division protein FtsZ [Alphaproteobacteria bacterium]
MTLNLKVPTEELELRPRLTVIGVGGAGGNAVNNMIRSNLVGCEFIVCNTDAQAMKQSLVERRIQLGITVTRGLGAGSRPDVGQIAAEEALDEIMMALEGSNMVFITAGMGGGTGTGAGPVIARAAREAGILTVGVVTKPFHFEGTHRMKTAEKGIEEMTKYVDTLLIIPNQNLFRVANERTTFADAFKMADDVLHAGVRGVTDLMVMPGLINLDFADIRAVMSEMGKAMMGTGEAEGDRRAIDAAEAAISNPLLEDVSMKGARGVLINITGGPDMTLYEVDEAANRIREEVDPDANIIFGSTFDEKLAGRMRISVVATGIDADQMEHPKPLEVVQKERAARDAAIQAIRPAAAAVAAPAVAMPYVVQPAAAVPVLAPEPEPEPEFAEPAVASAEPAMPRIDAIEAQALSRGSFMPQRQPVEPVMVRPAPVRPAAAPNAFAEAAIANGARQPQRPAPQARRTPSLFERVANAGRLLHPQDEPATVKPVAEPAPAAARPQAVPQPTSAQPTLVATRPEPAAERPRAKDEDLLEIPAFLRRQAN